MIPLTNLDSLRLVSSSSATLDVVAIFEGADSGNTKQLTKISTATTTTIVNAPRQEREVNHVFVRNTHASTSVDITFQIFDGTNTYTLYKATVLAGQCLIWDKNGIKIYDAIGIEL
jgi:hypothetical protein